MDSLNAQEQRELQSRMEAKQMREFATIYSKMVQHCFDDCINDFSSKSLGSREENCVLRCVDKQMKASQRMSLRFQEQNAAVMGPMQGR